MTAPGERSAAATGPRGGPAGGGQEGKRRDAPWLRGCDQPLAEAYDVALLDLDGVVYLGGEGVPHAADALAAARDHGMRLAFVTNNASRPPEVVAEHLVQLGIKATRDDVVTSAQAAAHLLADRLPPGARVLLVGGDGLELALRERGLVPVRSADDDPAAVVQGFAPEVDWRMLAEAAIAVGRGLPWVASNGDLTVPTVRGVAPGNGALVETIRIATGREPEVAGKPRPPLHRETVERTGARAPLVVGDRLDTDIEGAFNVGCDSLLVLTGVTTEALLLAAAPQHRPTYLAADLRGLTEVAPSVERVDGGFGCAGWVVRDHGDDVVVEPPRGADAVAGAGASDPRVQPPGSSARLAVLRAACALSWARLDRGGEPLSPHVLAGLGEH